MKILFITNVPAPYRVEFFSLLGKRCDLTVLYEHRYATNRSTHWKSNIDKRTYTEIYLNANIRVEKSDSITFSVLKYLNHKYNFIIVGTHGSPTEIIAMEYMKLLKIPYLVNLDGALVDLVKKESKLKFLLKKHIFGGGIGYITTGDNSVKYLKRYGICKEKIYTYKFSSVLNKDILKSIVSDEEKLRLRIELGLRGKKIIVSVGQFVYRKGYDLLIKAAEQIGNDIEIYIIGGNNIEIYDGLINKNNTKIHFIDFKTKNELEKYYKAADLFVLPTRQDEWGLVINEAMSKGLPIITTDRCNAGLEMVDNNVNGFIIKNEDVDDLVGKIKYILEDDVLRIRMGKNNLIKAREYTIENMTTCHLKIFENFK